jgi:hypothetical protein
MAKTPCTFKTHGKIEVLDKKRRKSVQARIRSGLTLHHVQEIGYQRPCWFPAFFNPNLKI